ncbi:MAG TPA: cation transporter [Chloroflexi bacterium]|nr:cation transporter [Chloroflexota bacterium]
MTEKHPLTSNEARYPAVQHTLWGVLAFNLSVSLLKIVLGTLTGALSVVADGFHSLVDAASNLISLLMLRFAARKADPTHPYGYQRFETLGALFIGVLMLIAAGEIAFQAIDHWQHGAAHVEPLALYLMGVAFVVSLVVVWWETRQGRRWNSELLLADAAHVRSDLWITASVIVSLIGVRLGYAWLDPVAALVVAVLIVRAAWEVLKQASQYLTDASVVDAEAIQAVATSVPGVIDAHSIRSRGRPTAAFVDLHIHVPPGMGTEQAHAVATEVENRIKAEVDGVVEAMVHVEPAAVAPGLSPWDDLALRLRRLADGLGLGIHEIYIHALPEGGYRAEMHLEFPAEITLAEAHSQAGAFIRRARAEMPALQEVTVHLEPLPGRVLATEQADDALTAEVEAFAKSHCTAGKIRQVVLRRTGNHLTAAVYCALPGEMPLEEAHSYADALQHALLNAFPALSRAIVQVEPD